VRGGLIKGTFWRRTSDALPYRGARTQDIVGKQYVEMRRLGGVVEGIAEVDNEDGPRVLLEQLDDSYRGQQFERVGAVANIRRVYGGIAGAAAAVGAVGAVSAGDAGGTGGAHGCRQGAAGEGDGLDAALVAMHGAEHLGGGFGAGETGGQVWAGVRR
jgi:hypothetical protein